ncbi:cell surface protein SprA [Odoribacter lunatus]|uniref:T9SS outer membrane translocon Sov/SprA n=1 Tax=Odoribacter lunatus TaxID=2941335 RepID=UPI00203D22A4|nr:cell surface protein SprA [Odoribacter lunatus]
MTFLDGGDTLRLPIKENRDNAVREDVPPSPLFLKNPANIRDTVIYNPLTKRYVVMTLIGDKYYYARPYSMSSEDYLHSMDKASLYEYNHKMREEGDKTNFKDLVSQVQFLDKILTPIFGLNKVKINVQGSVELTLGLKTNKVENPTLPIDLRKTTTVDFDEKIQFNVNGNIGDLINLDWNYNTDATFDFENMLKLNYEGKEDDIVKKVEAGNVSLPLPGTLITGGQNLWGFRTDLQFGKLSVSSIFTQQKSESNVVQLDKGAEKQEFEVLASSYEANKHFFLSKYFRDNYDAALSRLPIINSGVTITKIEVWVTNKSARFEQARNIVAFVDLGENFANISNPMWRGGAGTYPDNSANTLYDRMNGSYAAIRDINQVTGTFAPLSSSFSSGKDYEKVENARLLDPSEYILNERLGYISLNQALNSDEVLAVAYEYTVRGEIYTVGELTSGALAAPSTLFVKMLRSTMQGPNLPTWDLMMKNVYNIGSYNLSSDDFVLDVLYQNDKAGTKVNYLPAGEINNKILLSVLNLDNLNSQQDAIPDGRFDYLEGVTVYSNRGRIIFPVLEPFGSYLQKKINNDGVASQYVFQELYDQTQSDAEKKSEKNKFYLKGSYKSSSSAEISLGGGDIPQGSVQVLAGGVELVENIDYLVDYTMGTVKILNQALLEAGTPITIKSENRSMFGMQTKTLIGTHLDYKFNDKFNLGATLMHMSEKPLTHKVNIGEEPISNTIWGLNASYNTESGFLTTLIDKLPFIDTKVKSHFTVDAEFAQFQPGTNSGAGGNAYIDDFEGSKIAIDMKSVTAWKLASVPQSDNSSTDEFPEWKEEGLLGGYNRAKLAWYVVDPMFYRMSTATPGHIRADKEQRSNHFVREIRQTEIFPDKDIAVGEVNIVPALSLAYYPEEKGQYNFDVEPSKFSAGINREGKLNNPETRWGGMMRAVQTNDFEAANVQYIEMWVMDPFVYNPDHKGGYVYFDLGSVSEDILKDGRKAFENGLPTSSTATNIDTTQWGRVPSVQSVTNGFDNNNQARRFQDVGLDGVGSEDERSFFSGYLDRIRNLYGEGTKAYADAFQDPSSDDYHFFRGSDYDAREVPILERYKKYNNTEGNSPTADMSPESYTTAATSIPDVEDINGDNTLNETEAYFRYKLRLHPNEMEVGKNFINNITTASVVLPNGNTEEVKWYQIKIPINTSEKIAVNGISDFKSIRFMRVIFKGFQDSVILRMASLDLVRDNWRKYEDIVDKDEMGVTEDPNTVFDISVVNLEENATKTPVNYVMPPGIKRVVDATNPQVRELNEQAMALKVTDLNENDARAVYKNVSLDILRYKTLQMDVHAEAIPGYTLYDKDMTLFLRMGSDNVNNYYEYELPLTLTPSGFYLDDEQGRLAVWPAVNKLKLPLRLLQELKLKRNTDMRSNSGGVDYSTIYEMAVAELDADADADILTHTLKVKGKPSLGEIRTIMIGIRNKRGTGRRSVEVWVNELRLSDFDNKGGWAANVRMMAKLADVATMTLAGSRMTPGFGSIEQHASEISREDYRSIDFSANVEFGKFFPQNWRLRIPMYYAYSRQKRLPEYDPLDSDIPLDIALKNAENKRVRDSIKRNAEEYSMRKSLNFTNVGFESKDGKSHLFDLSNLTLTFSYNKAESHDVNTELDLQKDYRGLVSYIYNGMPKIVEPFKKWKSLNSPFLRLIKDFNFYYMPSMLSVTSDITRNYREIVSKNLDNPDLLILPTIDKDFMWNRDYSFKYNLTRNLRVDFRATVQSRIDEPEGIVDRQRFREEYDRWKDTVWNNILDGGRPVNYNHDLSVDYTVPINKLPGLDWTNLRTMYATRYDWQAGAITKDSTELGNTIRNANSLQLDGGVSLTSLYNKSKFLRSITRPPRPTKGKSVHYDTEVNKVKKGRSFVVQHKLKTSDIRVKVTNAEGKQVKVGYETVGRNKVRINSTENIDEAKIAITGNERSYESVLGKMGRLFMGVVTGIKNVRVSYAEDRSTTLPGFLPEARWLGQESYDGRSAPGFRFLFGGQSEKFGIRSAQKGWLTRDSALNSPYQMSFSQNIYVSAIFEPFKNFRVDLTSSRTRARNMEEYLYYDGGQFTENNKTYSGNYSMTMIGLNSAFYKVGNDLESSAAVYRKFLEKRKDVSRDLAKKRWGDRYSQEEFVIRDKSGNPTGYYKGYGETSQEVLIGAFNRAYGVGDHEGLIPKILAMRPNWRITYNGLMEIPFMKKVFRSFSLNHAYRCKYNIGSFTTNMKYDAGVDGYTELFDAQENWLSQYDVNSVSINEELNPLVSMDMTWVNNLTTRFSVIRRRDVTLGLVSALVTENSSNELVIGAGYRFGNLPIFFKNKQLDNDINIQCDFSLRRNNTIIRRISEQVDQLTAGQEVMSIKVSADYTFNNRLNLRLFYDRVINTPYVSLSFPTTNTNFGVSVRFSLTQ